MTGHQDLKTRFLQEQLRSLEFPIVPAWEEAGPQPALRLDGRRLAFNDARERRALALHLERTLLTAGLRALPFSYIVVVESYEHRQADRPRFVTGHTVFTIGDGEIIRYQPVLIDSHAARVIGGCVDGLLCEVDAPDVSAWDGTPMPTTLAHLH